MTNPAQPRRHLTEEEINLVRRRARVLLLLDAAERAGVAPLSTDRLHAFAFLADVLSPVWQLRSGERFVVKDSGGPFYPQLQREMDRLVVGGLLEVRDISYTDRPRGGARITGLYALRFKSEHLSTALEKLGARGPKAAIDPADSQLHSFLVELAGALARLPDDEIERAAAADVTFSDRAIDNANLIYFETGKERTNRSVETAQRFEKFIPDGARLSPGEKLYLYATYLGRRVHGG